MIVLFGAIVGAGPVSDATEIACLMGGIGIAIVHGVVGGLAQLPQPLVPVWQFPPPQPEPEPPQASARELRPRFATSNPALVSRPIFRRSRRVKPARTSSWRFWNARYSSLHLRREIFSPLAL
ncbi:MAG TPA: hypothetical protein VFP84_32520 [Kofleriaceae bacterium]|nr:hypothetical protein [Kofleriaceae bacterium]